MKFYKLLLILVIWYLFVNSSERSEWYVELYHDENIVVKVPRNEYLYYKELLNPDYIDKKMSKNYYRIMLNESKYYERKKKMSLLSFNEN